MPPHRGGPAQSYDAKARFFDGYAEEWERDGFSPGQMAKVEPLLRRLGVGPGMTILEPGCGSGRLTKILSERVGPDGRIIAVDISPKMVEACRRVAGGANVRVEFVEIERIEIEPESVDLVLCFSAFPHFTDKPAALRTFAQCLARDGQLAVVHLMGSEKINDLHRKAGTAVERDIIPSAPEMESMLQGIGFRIVEFTDTDSGYFLTARRSAPSRGVERR